MGNYFRASSKNKRSSFIHSSNNNICNDEFAKNRVINNESYLSVASYDSKSNPTDTTSMSQNNNSFCLNLNKSNSKLDIETNTNKRLIKNNENVNSNVYQKLNSSKNILNFSSKSSNPPSKLKKSIVEKSINNSFRKEMSVILPATAKQTASVIFLHGLGDTGHGWSSVFQALKKPHIKYIFPTAPTIPVTLNGGFRMNAWFDILGLTPTSKEDEEGIKKSSQILMGLIQDEIKNGIPSESIFIGGFSQGGATALYTALTSPIKFAGVIALSTWLPLHARFPQELANFDGKLKTPIIQCHGDADPMVPLEWSKMTVQLLKQLGFSEINWKTYRGMGHSSTEEELDDINDFINKRALPQ